MRCWDGSQTNQSEVLDNDCHVTFTLIASISKVTLLQLLFSLDASSAKCTIFWKEILKGIQ